jgi:hypothetical protein
MAEILATRTSLPGCETPSRFDAVRAGALFASGLQPSWSPSAGQVRRAVAATLRRLGTRGCAAQMAGEFGDHPDAAAARMSWALATVHGAYPAAAKTPAPRPRPLAFAS